MSKSSVIGSGLNIISGFCVAIDMVLNKVIVAHGWPYWFMVSAGLFCCSMVVLAGILFTKVAMPTGHKWKWIFLRAFLGTAYWMLGVVAVQVGAAPGEVASLMSISIIAGCVVIIRPPILFGGTASAGAHAWLGHVCAASAGFAQSCAYIASRKVTDVSVSIPTLTAMLASMLLCLIMALAFTHEFELLPVLVESPAEAATWVIAIFVVYSFAMLAANAGSALCPVAISVTLYTFASMTLGYVVQIFIFGQSPELSTLAGAGLMLAAVGLMGVARGTAGTSPDQWQDQVVDFIAADSDELSQHDDSHDPGIPATGMAKSGEDDETESLASFVASEYSVFSASLSRSERPQKMRIRKVVQNSQKGSSCHPPAQQVGTIISVVPGAVA